MYTEFLLQALSLIGGLAFFLYGMNVMGDGLTRLSGGRLERILEKLTDNRIKAVLLGAGVTAVICDNGNGCRFCKFRNHEIKSGDWCNYGCQYWYYGDFMDSESDGN